VINPPKPRPLRDLRSGVRNLLPKNPRVEAAVRTAAALAVTIGVFAALVAALGAEPLSSFRAIWNGAGLGGNKYFFGQTVMDTALLALTGLAAAVPFSARLWNVGGEGQYVFGAFCSVAMALTVPSSWPDWLQQLIIVLAASLGGAVFAAIPGILKAAINANEVIISLMMTFVAIKLTDYAITDLWAGTGTNTTSAPDGGALLAQIWTPGTTVTVGAPMAVGALAIVWLIMARTGLGFQIRATGLGPHTAKLSGMGIKRVTVLSFVIGGACAGLAGSVYTVGVANGTLGQGFSANFGYLGVAVALVARLNPAWVLPSAFLFGALRVGGANLQVSTGLSNTVSDLLVAVFVILMLSFKVIRLRYAEAVQE
jgi:ABC-type uncharacterized transport system permease subunit